MGTIAKFTLACVCASLSSLAAAQVYKWVDERGVTHYGQRPPSSQSATPMRNAAPPAPAAAAAPAPANPAAAVPPTQQPGPFGPAKNSNAAAFANCRSRACTSVRRVDPDCKTSLCTEALALPDECSTITCQGRRSDLDRRVAAQQKSGPAASPHSAAGKADPQDWLTKKRAEGDAQAKARAVARCKESRGINCDDPKVAEQWAKQNQAPTEAERRQAQAARQQRQLCTQARGALGCP